MEKLSVKRTINFEESKNSHSRGYVYGYGDGNGDGYGDGNGDGKP